MSEWQKIVQFAEQSSAIKGVVLVSLKEGNFCAGADLEQMHDAQRRRSFQEMEQLVITAHRLFDAMERIAETFCRRSGRCLVWAVDSSWHWPATRELPAPIRGPVLLCRKSNWAFFLGSAALNVSQG